jgi:hypothetical protein
MSRETSTTIISAYRATSVVDTPMRKVEVLEAQDGRVLIRATEYRATRTADVWAIYLEHEEAQTLARVIINLEEGEVGTIPALRNVRHAEPAA